ncbi:MAG: GMC oxidoreductase, partial [Rhodospirillaceae bacterium]
QRQVFDSWAQLGNKGWSYEDVLPFFMKSENKIGGGDDGYHGRGGPFTVTEIDARDPLCDAFIAGAESLGIPRNLDYNGRDQLGIAYAQRSVHNGRRVSPARCFLYPAMRRGNTRVVTEAHVLGIVIEECRAVGVRFKVGGPQSAERTVRAGREVVLSAGAIASPHILQVSGIGPADRLREIGVPVVRDLPGVGANFRDHFAVRSVVRIADRVTINERARFPRLFGEVANYLLTRKGALALTPTLVYCFWKSNPALETSDIQITFTPASYPAGVQSGLDRFPGATVACWQHRPESTGHVQAVSADPFVYPEIQGNYLAETEDRRVLLAAMRWSRRILESDPFRSLVAEEIWPGADRQSDDELLDHARRTGNTAYHPMGACRMGPSERADTVVDDRLRVHGIQGLRVADASIMPTMPSANLNASTLMIGEKAAAMLAGDAA